MAFSLFFFVGISHFAAQVVVGSQVGIENIDQAQNLGLLLPSVFGGIPQSFQVDGDFEINSFHVSRCIVEVLDQSELVVDNANVVFDGSSLRVFIPR